MASRSHQPHKPKLAKEYGCPNADRKEKHGHTTKPIRNALRDTAHSQAVMGNSENQMKHPAFKAKIFIPSKGIDWRVNSSRLMYGGFILLITIAFIASQLSLSLSFDYLIRTLLFLLLGLILYASYWGAHENEKKFGKLEGEVSISLDSIEFNDYLYSWSQIDQVKFGVFAVVGEMLWSDTYPIARYYGGPAYSQGVNNFIEFMASDKKVKVFFPIGNAFPQS